MYFKKNFIFLLKRKTGVTIGRSNLSYELVSLLLLGTHLRKGRRRARCLLTGISALDGVRVTLAPNGDFLLEGKGLREK